MFYYQNRKQSPVMISNPDGSSRTLEPCEVIQSETDFFDRYLSLTKIKNLEEAENLKPRTYTNIPELGKKIREEDLTSLPMNKLVEMAKKFKVQTHPGMHRLELIRSIVKLRKSNGAPSIT